MTQSGDLTDPDIPPAVNVAGQLARNQLPGKYRAEIHYTVLPREEKIVDGVTTVSLDTRIRVTALKTVVIES